jgi:hypothetical protein
MRIAEWRWAARWDGLNALVGTRPTGNYPRTNDSAHILSDYTVRMPPWLALVTSF